MKKICLSNLYRKVLLLFAIFAIIVLCSCTSKDSISEPDFADRYLNAYKQYQNASCPLQKDKIKHYVYFARDREAIKNHPFLFIERFEGAQIKYTWKQLEPEKGQYDFSIIWEDFHYLLGYNKKLWIQLQDATFSPKRIPVPDYLVTDEYDGGAIEHLNNEGEVDGWVAKRWNQNVQYRFSLLLNALGQAFDGKIGGINLQESAIEISKENDPSFTPELYVQSLKIRMLAIKRAFPHSVTLQNANFMPGEWLPWEDFGYLRSIYEYGEEIGVGLSAPDLMVQRRGQLNHALAMMHEGYFSVPIGISVQDGNYIGKTNNMEVVTERENIVPMLHAFAKDFLKVDYMFWSYQEPYFTEDVMPCFQP